MDIEEVEDLVHWNLSFGVSVEETLRQINQLELLELFVLTPNKSMFKIRGMSGMNVTEYDVEACFIDLIHVKYKCPFCGKKHSHGSNKNLANRVESRSSHCLKDSDGIAAEVNIHITDNTVKSLS